MFLSQFSRVSQRLPTRSLWSVNLKVPRYFAINYRFYTTQEHEDQVPKIEKYERIVIPRRNSKIRRVNDKQEQASATSATSTTSETSETSANPETSENPETSDEVPLDEEEELAKLREAKEKRRQRREKIFSYLRKGILIGIAGTVVFFAVEGTLLDRLKQLEMEMQNYYFRFNNPTLGWKYTLLPPSPVKHYTVVLDLQDLISIEWAKDGTKRAKLRPFVDLFLDELSELCEIVVWSSSPDMSIPEYVQKLQRTIPSFHFFLSYAECTNQYAHTIKDLNRLNRPLTSVVNVVSNPYHSAYQPENALYIPHWHGNNDDETLLDAYVCLRAIFTNYHPGTTDVRQLLTAYASRDPSETNHREDLYPSLLQHHEVTRKRLAAMRRGY